MTPRISVIIPTQRRPKGLALAARSICRQAGLEAGDIELIIVDNDQCPSARSLAADLAGEAPFAVHYVHETATGVVNARNAGLAKAVGGLIAFLDDDEEAPAGWLAQMVDAQAAYEADVVFGPVRARAPDAVREHRTYLETFFSREGPARSGPIDRYYGCGNSLIRRAALPDWSAPFSMRRNLIGGEDDLLFGGMSEAGARFAWAADAFVWEDPVPERLTLGYTIRRAFAYGQGPSYTAAENGQPVTSAFE